MRASWNSPRKFNIKMPEKFYTLDLACRLLSYSKAVETMSPQDEAMYLEFL